MGGNDDYTGGLVFECTISEATFVSVQAVDNGGFVSIRNRQLSAHDISLPVSVLQQSGLTPSGLPAHLKTAFPEESRWPLYVIGVLLWIQMKYPMQMFNHGKSLAILVWSQVPRNRGVSSSASVEVAVMKAAAFAFDIALTGETLATACQWVESQVCNSACGLMDQMAVLSWRCVADLRSSFSLPHRQVTSRCTPLIVELAMRYQVFSMSMVHMSILLLHFSSNMCTVFDRIQSMQC